MFSVIANSGKPANYITEYLLDTESDVQNLPTVGAPGSKAFVIENSIHYMLNHKKQWIKVDIGSTAGGGSTSGTIIYDGGVEIYDENGSNNQPGNEDIYDGGEEL